MEINIINIVQNPTWLWIAYIADSRTAKSDEYIDKKFYAIL